jgi:uncharacterized protein (UPF0261 family)
MQAVLDFDPDKCLAFLSAVAIQRPSACKLNGDLMAQPYKALLLATMDTKSNEAAFIRSTLEHMNIPVMTMDAGIRGFSPVLVDISREEVAAAAGRSLETVQKVGHEGKALDIMISGAQRLAEELYGQDRIHGIISLGGSMGTTLGTAVMRRFPVGFPKVMISTMASRDTRSFVGTKDILMLHSVCDLSGLNRITRRVLRNGAKALAGMLQPAPDDPDSEKPLVVISTLGTTEACAQQLRRQLEDDGYEVVTFHTVGAGGSAMDEMILEEEVTAVIDLSLHEITDHNFGGDYDAGPERATAAITKGVPTVLVPGNVDFLVTGSLKTAEKLFSGRRYHQHNAAITVIGTTPDEMGALGRLMAKLSNSASGPYAVAVPREGFSAFDHQDGPLFNAEGRKSLIKTLSDTVVDKSSLHLLPHHVNDPAFARALLGILKQLTA